MSQGKLEVVKQEMTSVNIDILGIRELRWTGRGEFNSDDHYIYCCGQETLRRNRVAIIVNKRVWNAVLGCNLKTDRMISVHFQGKPFNITVIKSIEGLNRIKKGKGRVTPAFFSWTVKSIYSSPLSLSFPRLTSEVPTSPSSQVFVLILGFTPLASLVLRPSNSD